ncbi:hypothetical protein BV22DRAFT_1043692 [Leucogyrophana mollusca]|uniref:Uncharacterized protein n=1 Tax=Leucogyrophana mollusca TaxID=85980 RepID=A0ACB8BY32_9AGAM|nr:hypothetical protein BV22DRAFT_1043692 [Leucogyrophana mollusca]
MQFKFAPIFRANFAASFCTASVAGVPSDESSLAVCFPIVDLKDLSSPTVPTTGDKKTIQKVEAKQRKVQRKWAPRAQNRIPALAAAQWLLNVTQAGLSLPNTLNINLVNGFNGSESTDQVDHVTFDFSASARGGTSRAHGFEATNPSAGEFLLLTTVSSTRDVPISFPRLRRLVDEVRSSWPLTEIWSSSWKSVSPPIVRASPRIMHRKNIQAYATYRGA